METLFITPACAHAFFNQVNLPIIGNESVLTAKRPGILPSGRKNTVVNIGEHHGWKPGFLLTLFPDSLEKHKTQHRLIDVLAPHEQRRRPQKIPASIEM